MDCKISVEKFLDFVKEYKDQATNIERLRNLLLPDAHQQNEEERNFRIVFREISEIFIKYFSVNWIFGEARLKHKQAHINFRWKMLRRLRKPELFTYLN